METISATCNRPVYGEIMSHSLMGIRIPPESDLWRVIVTVVAASP